MSGGDGLERLAELPLKVRQIFQFANPAEQIVSMVVYRGVVLVATDRGLYEVTDDELTRICVKMLESR